MYQSATIDDGSTGARRVPGVTAKEHSLRTAWQATDAGLPSLSNMIEAIFERAAVPVRRDLLVWRGPHVSWRWEGRPGSEPSEEHEASLRGTNQLAAKMRPWGH